MTLTPIQGHCARFNSHPLPPRLLQAGAAEKGVPLYKHIADLAGNTKLVLPVPSFNIINGGVHAGEPLAESRSELASPSHLTLASVLPLRTSVSFPHPCTPPSQPASLLPSLHAAPAAFSLYFLLVSCMLLYITCDCILGPSQASRCPLPAFTDTSDPSLRL